MDDQGNPNKDSLAVVRSGDLAPYEDRPLPARMEDSTAITTTHHRTPGPPDPDAPTSP